MVTYSKLVNYSQVPRKSHTQIYIYKYTSMSEENKRESGFTAADYDHILGEGQNCSDYVDQYGNDLSKQPKGTLSETEAKRQQTQRKFQTGERAPDFGSQINQDDNGMKGTATHGVDDYNKILGEGQDDYKEGEYEDLLKKHNEYQKQQSQKQEYPPTHLHAKNEPDEYVGMEEHRYEREGMEGERDNIDKTAMIPGCGESNKMEKPHHYVSNDFQPESQLQARKMDERHIPEGAMNTTCPGFEGRGHHTPIPGAGQMSNQPDHYHNREFHLVGGNNHHQHHNGPHEGEHQHHHDDNMNMGTSPDEQAIPRIMKQQQEGATEKPEPQHQGVFAKLKKTISR